MSSYVKKNNILRCKPDTLPYSLFSVVLIGTVCYLCSVFLFQKSLENKKTNFKNVKKVTTIKKCKKTFYIYDVWSRVQCIGIVAFSGYQ